MKPDRSVLFANTLIILVVLCFAFILFWYKREGGAYLIGLISGAPVAAGFAAMNKKPETGATPDVASNTLPGPSEAAQAVAATTINVGTPVSSADPIDAVK